jgi:hypothetical protein
MSRPVPAEELELIERVISEYPEGIEGKGVCSWLLSVFLLKYTESR